MGMFLPEDPYYDEDQRQTGFNRYKQLLSRHFGDWIKLNALTILGSLPLLGGILLTLPGMPSFTNKKRHRQRRCLPRGQLLR